MLGAREIKTIESKLNELYKENETYDGSTLNNPYTAYAHGIAFTLEQFGYRVEWENGNAHVIKD